MTKNKADQVNHPSHYNQGKIEVIEFLEDQFMDRPHEWNAVKYLARAKHKGSEIRDLLKAVWYIQRRIALLKGRAPRPNDMPIGGKRGKNKRRSSKIRKRS